MSVEYAYFLSGIMGGGAVVLCQALIELASWKWKKRLSLDRRWLHLILGAILILVPLVIFLVSLIN